MSYIDELENRFMYHAPTGDQPQRYEHIRAAGKKFAQVVQELCPNSPERAHAKDRIDEAVMWANASIARHELPDQPQRYEHIRAAGKKFAQVVQELCPNSPERAHAKDRIDEAVMWANASIARHELPEV